MKLRIFRFFRLGQHQPIYKPTLAQSADSALVVTLMLLVPLQWLAGRSVVAH